MQLTISINEPGPLDYPTQLRLLRAAQFAIEELQRTTPTSRTTTVKVGGGPDATYTLSAS
jgi:hypothetical protein